MSFGLIVFCLLTSADLGYKIRLQGHLPRLQLSSSVWNVQSRLYCGKVGGRGENATSVIRTYLTASDGQICSLWSRKTDMLRVVVKLNDGFSGKVTSLVHPCGERARLITHRFSGKCNSRFASRCRTALFELSLFANTKSN